MAYRRRAGAVFARRRRCQPPSATGFAENPETYRRLKNLLEVAGIWLQLAVRSAAPSSREDLLRVHTPAYLDKLSAMSDAGGGNIPPHFAPFGQGSYEIACLSSGLVKQAVEDVVTGKAALADALSRPPGHHCLPDASMGFACLLISRWR